MGPPHSPPSSSPTSAQLFFFTGTATTVIYTLSLHDALPISFHRPAGCPRRVGRDDAVRLERRPHHTTRGTPGCGALHRAPEPRRGRRARPTGGRRARRLHRRDPIALSPLDRDPHAPGPPFRG